MDFYTVLLQATGSTERLPRSTDRNITPLLDSIEPGGSADPVGLTEPVHCSGSLIRSRSGRPANRSGPFFTSHNTDHLFKQYERAVSPYCQHLVRSDEEGVCLNYTTTTGIALL